MLSKIKLKYNSKFTSLLDMTYPVGSIYIAYTNTSPATRFGGTWTSISSRFLYGIATTSSVGVGGSNSPRLVAHSHTLSDVPGDFTYAHFTGTQATLSHSAHSHKLGSGDSHNLKYPGVSTGTGNWGVKKVKSGSDSTNYFLTIGSVDSRVYDTETSQSTTVAAHTYTPTGTLTGYVVVNGETSVEGYEPTDTDNMPAYQSCYIWRRTA